MADVGCLAGGGGVGGDLEDAAFVGGDAADDGAAVLQREDAALVLVGDDLAGIDDVFDEVAQSVAIAGGGEIGADSAAFVAESMAGLTSRRHEEFAPAVEAAAALHLRGQSGDFIDGVGLAGTFRRLDRLGLDGDVFRRGERGERFAFLGVGHGGERVVADGVDEAAELIPAEPRACFGEPREELAAQLGRPAFLGKAQAVGIRDLLLVGPCIASAEEIGAVAVVAGHALDGEPRDGIVLRGAHELDRLRDDFRGAERRQRARQLAIEVVRLRGKQRIESCKRLRERITFRQAMASNAELIHTHERELLRGIELGKVEFTQHREQRGLIFFSTHASERDTAFDHGPRLALLQSTRSPQLRRLALDGHTGGVAHETIRMTEMRPRLVDGLGASAFLVQALQLDTQLVLRRFDGRGGRRGAFFALIGHAIQRRLRATSADGKIHRAVLADHGIGQRQRLTIDELLQLRVVARAIRREHDGVERAIGPIAGVDGVLIFRGKRRAESANDAGRATRPHIDERRHDVRAVAEQFS